VSAAVVGAPRVACAAPNATDAVAKAHFAAIRQAAPPSRLRKMCLQSMIEPIRFVAELTVHG
jgi:hypothetical protein